MDDRHYYKGYPGRYRHQRNKSFGWSLGCLIPLLLLSTAGFLINLQLAYYEWNIFYLMLATIAGLFLVWFIRMTIENWRDAQRASFLPYFQKQVGGIKTFSQGHALARNMQRVDAILLNAGLKRLSDFGFADDFAGEVLIWHDASEGLTAVDSLLNLLKTDPNAIHDLPALPAVVEDLERIKHALAEASAKKIPFCFQLRQGGYTSGQELSVRKGSYF